MKERGGSPDAIGNPQLPEPDDDDDQDDTLDQPPDDDDDKPDGEAVPKPIEDARKDLSTDLPDHHSVGKPSDGIIYLNDDGERVKIAKDGRLYKVGSDGRRAFANSPRPKSFMTPEEWQKLSVKDRAIAKKAGDDVDKVVERMSKKLKDRGLGSSTDKKEEAEKDELLEDLEELRGDDGSDEEKKAKKKSKKDKKKEKKEKRRSRDDKSKDRSHKTPATPSTKCDWDSDDDFFGMSPKSISSESTCFPTVTKSSSPNGTNPPCGKRMMEVTLLEQHGGRRICTTQLLDRSARALVQQWMSMTRWSSHFLQCLALYVINIIVQRLEITDSTMHLFQDQ